MSPVDDLISETRRLLQNLEDVKSELERSSTAKAKRWNAATPRLTSTISSTQPTIDDRLRICRKALSTIVTDANALLERLPSELTATAHTQPDGDTQKPLNPSSPSPLVPILLHNEAQVRSDQPEAEQLGVRSGSPTTSLSSANSDIIADFIAGFGDTLDQRKADDTETRQEGTIAGDERCRDQESCNSGSEACAITAAAPALKSPATTSNMKRTRASLGAAPKLKKTRTVLKRAEAGLAYGHFTYTQIYDKFARSIEDNTTIELLTRLFFAIASPEAMSQLLLTCHLRRDGNTDHLFPHGETVGEAMEALDKVDEVVSGCSIVHRYHLLSLVRRRTCLIQEQKLVLPEERTRNGRVQRAETLALGKLFQEVYAAAAPEQPSQELQTKLKNRLRHGRNWSSLVDRFSIGILAVVPTGKHTGLTNPQIELVKEQTFQLFLTILDQERGRFLRTISDSLNNIYRDVLFNPEPVHSYVFEGMDQNALAKTPFDSESLLGYCANVNA